jgi:leucyl-tRNA synthetase
MLRIFAINILKFNRQYFHSSHYFSYNFSMETTTEIKSFKRRDRLIEIESEAQKIWNQEGFHQADPIENKKKFMVTFPYPYVNGRIHLGHAYSFSKAEFTVRFMRLKGFNALWPFAFHCTGMPIAAAANRLEREYNEHGEGISKWAEEGHAEFKRQVEAAKDFDKKKKENAKGGAGGKKGGGAKGKDTKEEVKKEEKKKEERPEVTQKLSQYTILNMSGIEDKEMPPFKSAEHWFKVFPKMGRVDLERFGIHADFRRSFITTELNPYYDSFVRWQFFRLKEKGLIDFGKRPTVFSTVDNQACADHDRASGEGATPQEYTNIKLEVLALPEKLKAKLDGRKVFMVAATLRPETMYGQTNCYILPSGKYGAFEMKDDEVFICSERAGRNMAYQDLTKESHKLEKICDVDGSDMIGTPLKAPLTKYEKIYLWPMNTISMKKGTGVVTSVPSDSPDDWMNLKELQSKPAYREKLGLTDEMVMPFEPTPIMDIPELGNLSAVKVCEDLKVNGPGDKEKLAQAKDICYDGAFYKGTMSIGKYKG